MAAYCFFDNLEVLDSGKLEEYKSRVGAVVNSFGGRYVVLGGQVDQMEGGWKPSYPVMIEFPNLQRAHDWYSSDEYKELKALRLQAVRSNAVFIEGL